MSYQHIDGLLAVNKPAGVISKDVSRWLVKRIGKVKLGHVGTLDPAASGVLPLLLGRATRLQDFLLELPKTYEFDITFGSETDTLDQDGKVVREAPWDHVTEGDLRASLERFIGDIEQVPPIYSAVKYKGRPLYDYARGGDQEAAAAVPLAELKRRVSVSKFELLNFRSGSSSFRITCSKGTYVRSLVRDVSETLGTCGTLTRLVRTSAAGIDLAQSYGLEGIESQLDGFESLIVPMAQIKTGLAHWSCPDPLATAKLRGGQNINVAVETYLAGLTCDSDRALPSALSKSVLLISDKGAAFGVGTVLRNESGRVVIALKRGL